MNEIDWGGALRTEDGREVRYIGKSPDGRVYIEVRSPTGHYQPYAAREDQGGAAERLTQLSHEFDVVFIVNAEPPPPKTVTREGWAPHSKDGTPDWDVAGTPFGSLDEAYRHGYCPGELTRIEWTEPAPGPASEAERCDADLLQVARWARAQIMYASDPNGCAWADKVIRRFDPAHGVEDAGDE